MLSTRQTVALTFDDAPDATNTARVLNALANAGVKATFFVNTNNQMNVASSSTAQVYPARSPLLVFDIHITRNVCFYINYVQRYPIFHMKQKPLAYSSFWCSKANLA